MALNLAQKFSNKIDERFTKEAYATGVCGNSYDFDGVDTVKVYNIPTVPMVDYARHGSQADRYGTATDLQAGVQTMVVKKDRSFTFTIDRGDITQQMAILEANKALSRQTNEVVIPEYDRYIFRTLAEEATAAGNYTATRAIKSKNSATANAYELLSNAQEWMGDHMVPDEGRVAICSYAFANALKMDPNFVMPTDIGMGILQKGVVGMVDGITLKQVPSNRLPNGCGCILTHPYASVAPQQLKEYKIHDNPPGLNGYKVEGRFIYDCFVLNQKVNGIYYIGMSGVNRALDVSTSPDPGHLSGNTFYSLIHVEPYESSTTVFYRLTAAPSEIPHGAVVNTGSGTESSSATYGWTALTANNLAVAYNAQKPWVEVVEVDNSTDKKVVGYGKAIMYSYDQYKAAQSWRNNLNF